MKKLILICLLFFTALTLYAQTSSLTEEEKSELRQRIGIDYSISDFNTSSINEKVIGTRLAKMLKYLDGNTNNYNVYSYLSSIQREQIEGLNYVTVESYKIKNISKQGDVITIKLKTKLKQNAKNIKSADLLITFDKGVSESQAANDLFCDLGRYARGGGSAR